MAQKFDDDMSKTSFEAYLKASRTIAVFYDDHMLDLETSVEGESRHPSDTEYDS